ncbi:MAG TPA: GNAT family N-acetyltransferase [Alphaproteobacteria bacterium]|nr:GNAT family N-acetyltransferase [Alphaproteobacteria bacterium]
MTIFKQGWPLNNTSRKQAALKPRLQGFRVLLKAPEEKDYQEWALVRAKNQEFLTPYEPQWAEDCLTNAYFKRRLARQDEEYRAGRGCYFLIHHRRSGDIIGGINLNNIQMGAACFASLGYWIDSDYQGQGYMKEAAALVIDYAFNTLHLKRLNAGSLPHNARSIGLLKSLGFEEEGYAKKYLQINGAWQDHVLFGLIPKQE